MNKLATRVHKPVFVDRYGRRRKAVIGTGLVLALALVAWLAVMAVGVAVVLSEPRTRIPAGIDAA